MAGAVIEALLRHDEYEQVPAPQVGDVVVYRAGQDIDHTGLVCEVIITAEGQGLIPAVFVWSMWGSLGEFRHRVRVCPYAEDCTIEYWRLKR